MPATDPSTDTYTLAAALDALPRDIHSDDGVASAAITEAAQRLRELAADVEQLNIEGLRRFQRAVDAEAEVARARSDERIAMTWLGDVRDALGPHLSFDKLVPEVERLRGIKPEFGPRPPHDNDASYQHPALPRYGIRWNGPTSPLAVPMNDGYWTPFHLAHAEVERLTSECNQAVSATVRWNERALSAESRLRELASAQPVAILHTGSVFGGEQDEWEFEVDRQAALAEFCSSNPGQKIALIPRPEMPS